MGQEIYILDGSRGTHIEHNSVYEFTVQSDYLVLALNSFILALMSLVVVPLSRLVGGVK